MDLGENLKSRPANWKCLSWNLKAQRCVKGENLFTSCTLWQKSKHPTSWKLNKTDGWAFTSSVEVGSNILCNPLLLSYLGGILFWMLSTKPNYLKWFFEVFSQTQLFLLCQSLFDQGKFSSNSVWNVSVISGLCSFQLTSFSPLYANQQIILITSTQSTKMYTQSSDFRCLGKITEPLVFWCKLGNLVFRQRKSTLLNQNTLLVFTIPHPQVNNNTSKLI